MQIIIGSIVWIIVAVSLLLKPMVCAKVLGTIFWNFGRPFSIGRTEESKRYYFAKGSFWFRLLGGVLLVFFIINLVLNLSFYVQFVV